MIDDLYDALSRNLQDKVEAAFAGSGRWLETSDPAGATAGTKATARLAAKPYVSTRAERLAFLEAASAKPTTKEAFALWYSVYLKQSGERATIHQGHDYPTTRAADKTRLSLTHWTPAEAEPIPALSPDSALTLLIITPHIYLKKPDTAIPNASEHSGWGSNTLLFLDMDFSGGEEPKLTATTNKLTPVLSYRSVEAYRQGKTIPTLLQGMFDAEPGR